jgi:hypothetical protein
MATRKRTRRLYVFATVALLVVVEDVLAIGELPLVKNASPEWRGGVVRADLASQPPFVSR